MSRILTGAQMLMEALQIEGVDVFFGYPGGAVLDIYDEITRHPRLRHILVRHEQAAVHAADGYARATGRVGVALVTSGPGATNAVTGIATANCDSVPIVVFSGQVNRSLIGNDAFQEVDIVGITRPCTKHNYLVQKIEDLPEIIAEAFYVARSGRPGAVLVDLPKDVVQARALFSYPEKVTMRSYNPTYVPNQNQLRKAARMILGAKRPLIISGGGAISSGAEDELFWLADRLNIPVTTTLMGLGSFPASDPLFLGMPGMHGTYAANRAINACDVLIAVGMRFDDRVTGLVSAFAPKAKIVHVDIDPSSIGKNIQVDVPLVADCKHTLAALKTLLEEHLDENDVSYGRNPVWRRTIQTLQDEHPLFYARGDKIKPQEVVESIQQVAAALGRETIITTEVGQNQMWAAQFYKFDKPRTLLSSGGLGTMGYGLPAALGAQAAFPEHLVVDIAGDGSIQMNSQELATAVESRLPVKIVILNNQYLGMVRQWQELFYKRNYSFTPMQGQPDFVALAKAYGAEGYRVTRPDRLRDTLREAFASPLPAIVDVHVDREENVYPMVPANGAIDDMMLS
ncbi:MAG: biosynthetic-type acetolactate synthase large subunit [Desulfovibrionaceae bacterium]|nr:biosynthetic-type acetolactate synthase large subunit [Desulfovibrionaceae bacterium]